MIPDLHSAFIQSPYNPFLPIMDLTQPNKKGETFCIDVKMLLHLEFNQADGQVVIYNCQERRKEDAA